MIMVNSSVYEYILSVFRVSFDQYDSSRPGTVPSGFGGPSIEGGAGITCRHHCGWLGLASGFLGR